MNETIKINGDQELLLELCRELKAAGVDAHLARIGGKASGEIAPQFLNIIGAASVIATIVASYLKNRRGKISIEADGHKIAIEGKDTDDTIRMLRQTVVVRRLQKGDGSDVSG